VKADPKAAIAKASGAVAAPADSKK
jgi:hypothetical protein